VKALQEDRHPVTPADERAEILAHLSVVDHVTIFEEKDVRRVLRALKPHFHAKGTDYTAATVPERDEVEALGGRVIITGDAKSHSSRDVIREIVSRFRNG
jgi:bifunctional ADP-heptose synthase (sugar kinase/adenylyltransferase)